MTCPYCGGREPGQHRPTIAARQHPVPQVIVTGSTSKIRPVDSQPDPPVTCEVL